MRTGGKPCVTRPADLLAFQNALSLRDQDARQMQVSRHQAAWMCQHNEDACVAGVRWYDARRDTVSGCENRRSLWQCDVESRMQSRRTDMPTLTHRQAD